MKKRKIKRWLIVLGFLVIALVCIKLRLKNITVRGSLEYYTEDEAAGLVFSDYWDKNTFVCLVKSLTGDKKSLPFISDYKVNVTGPESCELIIYEKKPVGCIKYMDSFMYFDKDGIMIESGAERLDGIPVIQGVSFGYVVLGQKLPVKSDEVFTDIMNITQQMDEKNMDCEGIKFDDIGNITLTLDDGDIDVDIGQNDYLEVKINALSDMLPQLENKGLKGTLELKDYTDRIENGTVSFKVRQ